MPNLKRLTMEWGAKERGTMPFLLGVATTLAADHAEAPAASSDPAADIGDFYAWHEGDRLTAVITHSPLTSGVVHDADVLYAVHVDNDGDFVADETVWVQVGADGDDWGVRAIVGENEVVGPVDEPVGDELQVYAGLRDDPFFFDLTGYSDTLATASLQFTGADFFAGQNVMAIVVELPTSWVSGGSTNLNVWATTARSQ